MATMVRLQADGHSNSFLCAMLSRLCAQQASLSQPVCSCEHTCILRGNSTTVNPCKA